MNKDIYYILLKSQKEIIKKMEDEIYDLRAKLYITEHDRVNKDDRYHLSHCLMIERLVRGKEDKKFILKLLQLMYARYKDSVVNEHEYNPNIVALCWPKDVTKLNGYSKKLIKTLYHYLGKDFASKDEVDKLTQK